MFISHHLRVRLWLVSKKAARQVGEAHKASFPSRSPERMLIASAARIYYESHNSLDPELRVDVPSAITMYPRDIEKCPRPWAQERYRRIVRWRSPERGGHFPSLEVPGYFVEDLREGLGAVLAADR